MRRLIASVVLVGILFTGVAVATDVADPEPAAADHYYAHSVCQWEAVKIWGPGVVTVIIAKYPVYAWGETYYYCRVRVLGTSRCHSYMIQVGTAPVIIFHNIPCNGAVP